MRNLISIYTEAKEEHEKSFAQRHPNVMTGAKVLAGVAGLGLAGLAISHGIKVKNAAPAIDYWSGIHQALDNISPNLYIKNGKLVAEETHGTQIYNDISRTGKEVGYQSTHQVGRVKIRKARNNFTLELLTEQKDVANRGVPIVYHAPLGKETPLRDHMSRIGYLLHDCNLTMSAQMKKDVKTALEKIL